MPHTVDAPALVHGTERMLLRPREVAEALGMSLRKTYDLIRAGEIPSLKIGDVVRVRPEDLRTWIARKVAEQM